MSLQSRKHLIALLFIVGFTSVASAAPIDLEVFTDFDELVPNTVVGVPFDIGTEPERATFGGDAFKGIVGIPELYFSGSRAWMVIPSGTGIIDFETNAVEVEFWGRTRSFASGSSVFTAFDDANGVIDTVTLTKNDNWQLISFSGNIDHIEVVNNDLSYMNSIDDFGFTPIPEPSTFVLGFLGLVALIGYRCLKERSRRMSRSVSHGGTFSHVSHQARNGSHQVRADFPRSSSHL